MRRKKLIPALVAVFLVNIAVILLFEALPAATAAVYRRGSTGSGVTELQEKLQSWGYYTGEVDGVYGGRTEAAVKSFQRKNGLTVDGIAGPATLSAMGISGGSQASAQSNDTALLARLISAEARGEPYVGQVAVGRGPEPDRAPLLSGDALRRDLPVRRLLLPAGRPVGRARGRQRLSGRPGRSERLGPNRGRHLLL